MGMAGELGNGVLKAFFVTKVSVSGIPSGHDVLSFIKVVPLSLFGFIFFGSTTNLQSTSRRKCPGILVIV